MQAMTDAVAGQLIKYSSKYSQKKAENSEKNKRKK